MPGLTEKMLSITILILMLAVWIEPLNQILREPDEVNSEYSPEDFEQLEMIADQFINSEDKLSTVIASRKFYLAYLSGQLGIATPYTNFDGLTRYLSLNDADFLFVEHRMLEGFPFMDAFSGEFAPPQFELAF